MVSKVCLCFLTVIHISAAFEFQSDLPSLLSTFHAPAINQVDTPSNNQVKNVVSAKEQQSRLQKMEDLVGKQEERMGQLNESLKEQGKLSQVQEQMLAKMQASQLEEKSHLSAIEEVLHQLDGRLVAFEDAAEHDSDMAVETHRLTTHNDKPKVNFTTIQDVGLSFTLIMEPVKYKNMEQHCAQLADGGRLIVLDSKSKLDALKTYVASSSEKPSFFVGLRKTGDRHLWSNGEEIDPAFWCTPKNKVRKNVCGSVKIKGHKRICMGAARCTKGKMICEKPL